MNRHLTMMAIFFIVSCLCFKIANLYNDAFFGTVAIIFACVAGGYLSGWRDEQKEDAKK